MIIALSALELLDEAAVYVELLLTWHDPAEGGFRRPTPDDPINRLATEQAAYALAAYWRAVNGMSPLFDMR
jgi:hypothetical protein